jgi:hypothetical protein
MIDPIKELSQKYPDYIFIKLVTHSRKIKLNKSKFMTPYDMTVGHFLNSVRHRQNMDILPDQTLICLINDRVPRITDTLGELYYKYRNNDGLLYISVESESVFG